MGVNRLQEKWKENGMSEDKINEAKTKLTEAVKKVLKNLDDYQFFLGNFFPIMTYQCM